MGDEEAQPGRIAPPGPMLGAWLREGVRGALLRAPRAEVLRQASPTPALVLALMLLSLTVGIVGERLATPGAADFHWRALLGGWFSTALAAWLCWWAADRGPEPDSTAAPRPGATTLFALLTAQGLVIALASAVALAPALRWTGAAQVALGLWWASTAWLVLAQLRLLLRYARPGPRVGIVMLTLAGAATWVLAPAAPVWTVRDDGERAAGAPRFLQLTPELIERQQQAAATALDGLVAQRPGLVDLYVLTFAPYGSEDVFRRESAMVVEVLEGRFDAVGRSAQLVNHPDTAGALSWATPANLQRAISRVAERMDRDEDILFIHLTSHGARDGQLAARLWPMEMPALTPAQLRRWLDEAGIRHRVISVSACYAGSWIEPLASDSSLVMTAADADHTSYGCGSGSELTFFGRAVFDEQLRGSTRSFEQAHAAARTVILKREREAGKTDGYSNPQIRVGDGVRAPLARLEARLAAP